MTRCQILRVLRKTVGILFILFVVNISLSFGAVDCYIQPWGAPPWVSPDIYADNNGNGVQECGDPSKGISTNRLFARIHNIGVDTATNVKVRFYYAPYSAGYHHEHFKQIGSPVTIPSIPGSTDTLIEIGWDLSDLTENNGGLWPNPISYFDHFCVRVEIECPGDIDTTNNSAQTNFTAVPCSNCGFNFIIANPKSIKVNASLDISRLPERWGVNITGRGIKNIQEFTLGPKQAIVARLELSHPEIQEEMNRDISVSLKLDGELISGFTFRPVKTPIKPIKQCKFSLSFHAGYAIPLSSFNKVYNPGPSVFVDFDYHFRKHLSTVLLVGYNGFKSEFSQIPNTYWWNISANLKKEFPVAPKFNLYINAGPGVYIPKAGYGHVKTGFNAGLGFNYSFTHCWKLEFGNDYHYIFGDSKIRFMVTHIGIIHLY